MKTKFIFAAAIMVILSGCTIVNPTAAIPTPIDATEKPYEELNKAISSQVTLPEVYSPYGFYIFFNPTMPTAFLGHISGGMVVNYAYAGNNYMSRWIFFSKDGDQKIDSPSNMPSASLNTYRDEFCLTKNCGHIQITRYAKSLGVYSEYKMLQGNFNWEAGVAEAKKSVAADYNVILYNCLHAVRDTMAEFTDPNKQRLLPQEVAPRNWFLAVPAEAVKL